MVQVKLKRMGFLPERKGERRPAPGSCQSVLSIANSASSFAMAIVFVQSCNVSKSRDWKISDLRFPP